jgi:hypothetical protein
MPPITAHLSSCRKNNMPTCQSSKVLLRQDQTAVFYNRPIDFLREIQTIIRNDLDKSCSTIFSVCLPWGLAAGANADINFILL